jgi:hypothetical protein
VKEIRIVLFASKKVPGKAGKWVHNFFKLWTHRLRWAINVDQSTYMYSFIRTTLFKKMAFSRTA